jgi:hypothetical protein
LYTEAIPLSISTKTASAFQRQPTSPPDYQQAMLLAALPLLNLPQILAMMMQSGGPMPGGLQFTDTGLEVAWLIAAVWLVSHQPVSDIQSSFP